MHQYINAFLGGTLLGISVVGYLYINGKIAGISGLIAQQLDMHKLTDRPAFWFILGLLVMPFLYREFDIPEIQINSSPISLIIAGLLVGIGTRIGSGCTSGHGICGLSRLSSRSIVATLVFMSMGFMTVFVMNHIINL